MCLESRGSALVQTALLTLTLREGLNGNDGFNCCSYTNGRKESEVHCFLFILVCSSASFAALTTAARAPPSLCQQRKS